MPKKWSIEYERGRAAKPWIVSRLVPGLTRSGKISISAFALEHEARQQIEEWEARLARERNRPITEE